MTTSGEVSDRRNECKHAPSPTPPLGLIPLYREEFLGAGIFNRDDQVRDDIKIS